MKINCRFIKSIGLGIFAALVLSIVPASNVYAEDWEAVRAAQQAAIEAEKARIAQQEAAQAQSDLAVAMAQQRAKEEAAAALYATWGEVPPEYLPYLNSANAGGSMVPGTVPGVVPGVAPAVAASKTSLPAGSVVDIVIFAGQSNMSGAGGNAGAAPKVLPGRGYEFKAITDPTGLYPVTEPFGAGEVSVIGDGASGARGSLVSSFVNTYYQLTGVPVIAISASRGATDSNFWCNAKTKADLSARFAKATTYLATNRIAVRKKYLVFLQGESDAVNGISPAQYQANLNSAFSTLFASGLNQVFIITPGTAKGGLYSYDSIINAQKNLCATNGRFTLASATLRNLSDSYLTDQVHYNQQALNMVGAEAARAAASYTALTSK